MHSMSLTLPKYLDNPMKTGLGYMDYILGEAGFFPTQCTVLTGDPGSGKTTLALEMASSMRGLGTTVAFASCEMRKEMVAKFQKRLKARHPIKVITDKISVLHVDRLASLSHHTFRLSLRLVSELERSSLTGLSSLLLTHSRNWMMGTLDLAGKHQRQHIEHLINSISGANKPNAVLWSLARLQKADRWQAVME
jgi:RecA/RadA recombinase